MAIHRLLLHVTVYLFNKWCFTATLVLHEITGGLCNGTVLLISAKEKLYLSF